MGGAKRPHEEVGALRIAVLFRRVCFPCDYASAEANSLKIEQHSLEIARGIPPVNGVYI